MATTIITANGGADVLIKPELADPQEVSQLETEVADLKEGRNMLACESSAANPAVLDPETAVYRLALSGANPALSGVVDTAIPEGDSYYCFELEVSVDSAATGTIGWPASWDWLEDPPGLSDCLGKTAYVACRLDCRAAKRTVTANCWRVA